jgi:pimeloyl-ACP methyl ester carboxylesterase
VVVHGGPGAAGDMAPVARKLSLRHGVIEPWQTADSIHGQVMELSHSVEQVAVLPVMLIGFSWGAWLSLLTASEYPELIQKVIIIGSGPFEEAYAPMISEVRRSRMTIEQRARVDSLMGKMSSDTDDATLCEIGRLISAIDAYDPLQSSDEDIQCSYTIYDRVWREASELRRSGRLLEQVMQVRCPVTAIHGDHDPHPAEGVEKPLSSRVDSFKFFLLQRCGHKPWIERHAKDLFYEVLKNEIENK